jgi:TRAP-type C4-dicarboxylate transport system substrate-binding protein
MRDQIIVRRFEMNGKKLKIVFAVSTLTVAIAGHAQTKLLFNVFLPPGHVLQNVAHDWAADVEKATGNNVKIDFTAGNMAPPPQQLPAAASGIFDIAMTANTFIKSKAPLLEFVSLPFIVDNAESASVAYWRTYEKHFASKKQFPDVQLLSLFTTTGGQLYSVSDTPINSVDELKKRRMWAVPGEAADLLKNMGISPITSPAVQVSESVSRGVVDGCFGLSPDGAYQFKASPYTKVITWLPKSATVTGFSMFINKVKWASISEKDRNAIMALSGEALARRVGKAYEASATEALAKMKADGIKLVNADAGFYAALQKAAEPSFTEFEAVAAKAGLDGKAVLADFRAEYAAASKH